MRSGCIPRSRAHGARLLTLLVAVTLAGCRTTQLQQLQLQRDQLLRIESTAAAVRQSALAGDFTPGRYDLYLLLNRTVFDTLMSSLDGLQVGVDAGGRPIQFTLSKLRVDFRPGNPEVTVAAVARDTKLGLEASVDLDSRLLIERDSAATGQLYLRVVATRIVPRISWGPFNFARRDFARRLLALEATKFTEGLPRITLPTHSAFTIGSAAGSSHITLPTGEGTIGGDIVFPSTLQHGQVTVRQILALSNGVHIFADAAVHP